jgi:hypothetical protein
MHIPYFYTTWVPVITLVGGAGNTVPVYTTNLGTYTIRGNTVFCNINLSGDGGAEGAGTGLMYCSLPRASGATQLEVLVPAGSIVNGGSENVIFARLLASQSTVQLYRSIISGSNVETDPLTGAQQNNATRFIQMQLRYRY